MTLKIIFLIYIFILPVIGKKLDLIESIVFFLPPILFILLEFLYNRSKKILTTSQIKTTTSLIVLYIFSIIFSKNPGTSYYHFFIFLNVLLVFLLSIHLISPKEFKYGLISSSLIFTLIFLLNKAHFIHLPFVSFKDNFILQVWGHSYLADLLILAIPTIIFSITASNYWKYVLILLPICVALPLTNSRSAVFSLLVGLLLFKSINRTQRYTKSIILGFMVFCLCFQFLFVYLKVDSKKSLTGERLPYWREAVLGIKDAPLFGNGPASFAYLNKKYETTLNVTVYTHNLMLWLLSEYGFIFTTIFFIAIIKALIKNYHLDNLYFSTSIISIVHSMFDPTWNSVGILIISLYFIFYHSFQEKHKKYKWILISPILLILTAYFISQFTSYYFSSHYHIKNSLVADPFNLHNRLNIIETKNFSDPAWQKNKRFTLKVFPNETSVYNTLVSTIPLPQSESYYYKLFELSPQENYERYVELANYYHQIRSVEKLKKLLIIVNNNFKENQLPTAYALPLAQVSYRTALDIYKTNPQDSVVFFEKSVKLFPMLSHLHIELANAYWNNGEFKKAFQELSNCESYDTAKSHCKEYLIEHQHRDFPQPGDPTTVEYINSNLYK